MQGGHRGQLGIQPPGPQLPPQLQQVGDLSSSPGFRELEDGPMSSAVLWGVCGRMGFPSEGFLNAETGLAEFPKIESVITAIADFSIKRRKPRRERVFFWSESGTFMNLSSCFLADDIFSI